MVGLSVVLEAQKTLQKRPQILSKITMIRPSPSATGGGGGGGAGFFPSTSLPPISFLDSCFLCSKRLCPGNDIYMYKGDRAFCSVECRCRQIFMDEENLMNENCSAAAASPPSASSSRRRKGNRNRGSGLFAY